MAFLYPTTVESGDGRMQKLERLYIYFPQHLIDGYKVAIQALRTNLQPHVDGNTQTLPVTLLPYDDNGMARTVRGRFNTSIPMLRALPNDPNGQKINANTPKQVFVLLLEHLDASESLPFSHILTYWDKDAGKSIPQPTKMRKLQPCKDFMITCYLYEQRTYHTIDSFTSSHILHRFTDTSHPHQDFWDDLVCAQNLFKITEPVEEWQGQSYFETVREAPNGISLYYTEVEDMPEDMHHDIKQDLLTKSKCYQLECYQLESAAMDDDDVNKDYGLVLYHDNEPATHKRCAAHWLLLPDQSRNTHDLTDLLASLCHDTVSECKL